MKCPFYPSSLVHGFRSRSELSKVVGRHRHRRGRHCRRPCLAGWLVGPLAGYQYGRRRPGQAGRLLQLPWACSRPPGWPPPPLAGRQAVVAAAGVQEAWPPLLGSNETILHICYFYVKNILDSKMCKKNPRHNNKHNNHDFISKFHEFKVNKFISHNHNFNLEVFHLI